VAEGVDPEGSRPAAGVAVLDLVEALPRLADEVVLPTVWETQRAVRNRVYGVAARMVPRAAVARELHGRVADGSAGVVRLSLRGSSMALRGVRAGLAGRVDPRVRGRGVRAGVRALNGLVGDRLSVEAPGLAVRMSVRDAGHDVELDAAGLAAAFPDATGRIAVFLHGLCDDEGRWTQAAGPCTEAVRERGWTPTLVRFNSGLSLHENGDALARLLGELTAAWPAPPSRLALVGHSLGGLVAHTATEAGRTLALPWVGLLTDVVTLATPHLGSDLARLAAGGTTALDLVPETTPLARLLDRRSAGIKDLGTGLAGLEPAPGVRYRLVSGELGRPWGPLVGDLLVRRSSATGQLRGHGMFPDAEHVHLPSTGHLGVLRHPDLPARLRDWLR
jgi:hypothetical protein